MFNSIIDKKLRYYAKCLKNYITLLIFDFASIIEEQSNSVIAIGSRIFSRASDVRIPFSNKSFLTEIPDFKDFFAISEDFL